MFVDYIRLLCEEGLGKSYSNLRLHLVLACIFWSFFVCRRHMISSIPLHLSILSIELKKVNGTRLNIPKCYKSNKVCVETFDAYSMIETHDRLADYKQLFFHF